MNRRFRRLSTAFPNDVALAETFKLGRMETGFAGRPSELQQVPETGCLVTIGYPKFKGGLGGYARYVAICPADWRYGVSVGQVPDAPLPKSDKVLQWDPERDVRVRK